MSDTRVFVGDLTRKEFRERMDAGTIKAAIVPTAATEQHNEHLEMIHDTLHVTYTAEQAAKALHPTGQAKPGICWTSAWAWPRR